MCFLKMFQLTKPLLYLAIAFKEMFLTLYKAGLEMNAFRRTGSPVWSRSPQKWDGSFSWPTGQALVLGQK